MRSWPQNRSRCRAHHLPARWKPVGGGGGVGDDPKDHGRQTGGEFRYLADGLSDGLQELARRHRSIEKTRGQGLLIGFDLVTDQETKTLLTKEKCIALSVCLAEALIMMSYTPRVRVFGPKNGELRPGHCGSRAGGPRSGIEAC